MPALFHLKCSPRPGSVSASAAAGFLDRFLAVRPGWTIDVMDLWREALPEFDGAALEAKYAVQSGEALSPAQRDAFAAIDRMLARFARAERVLISTPMWNFGLPYKLKHWIDLVNQPGMTFRFDPAVGYVPLLRDRPTLVILASGGDFSMGMNRGRTDLATPYLREALRFMGVRDVRVLAVGPTAGADKTVAEARERAARELAGLAVRF